MHSAFHTALTNTLHESTYSRTYIHSISQYVFSFGSVSYPTVIIQSLEMQISDTQSIEFYGFSSPSDSQNYIRPITETADY